MLTFTLKENHYQLTFNQINDAFGIDRSQPLTDRFSKTVTNFKTAAKTEFWRNMTKGDTNFDSKMRDYRIIHPIWILAHRVLSASVTARREVGQVNGQDIFLLYCMYKKIRVDFCDFFLERCDTIRGRKLGDVGIGGLITILAVFAGFDPNSVVEHYNPSVNANFITLPVLEMKYGLIKSCGTDKWKWQTGDPNDPNAKHPCFKIPHAFMSKF